MLSILTVALLSQVQLPDGYLIPPTTSKTINTKNNTPNVLDYGAKCDNSTDDTAAIRSAITAAGAGGRVLFPETGNPCIVSDQLTMLANQHWLGPGRSIITLRVPATGMVGGVNQSVIISPGGGTIEDLAMDGAVGRGNANTTGITVSGGGFSCRNSRVYLLDNGIALNGASFANLYNCHAQSNSNNELWITSSQYVAVYGGYYGLSACTGGGATGNIFLNGVNNYDILLDGMIVDEMGSVVTNCNNIDIEVANRVLIRNTTIFSGRNVHGAGLHIGDGTAADTTDIHIQDSIVRPFDSVQDYNIFVQSGVGVVFTNVRTSIVNLDNGNIIQPLIQDILDNGTNTVYQNFNGQWNNIGNNVEVGDIQNSALATPVNAAFATSTTGGTLNASTSYCARIVATGSLTTTTLPSTETCITTAAGANTATVTYRWGQVFGANGYKVYCRLTGTEQLCATIGAGVLGWVDTGSVTPNGALPTINTTGTFKNSGPIQFGFTDTSGTPGNATANTASGRSAIANAASAATITNGFVTASSRCLCTLETSATGVGGIVCPTGAGSFTATTVNGTGVATVTTGTTKFSWECKN